MKNYFSLKIFDKHFLHCSGGRGSPPPTLSRAPPLLRTAFLAVGWALEGGLSIPIQVMVRLGVGWSGFGTDRLYFFWSGDGFTLRVAMPSPRVAKFRGAKILKERLMFKNWFGLELLWFYEQISVKFLQ